MNQKEHRAYLSLCILSDIMMVALLISSCSGWNPPDSGTTITPADSPVIPTRGFFLGILPTPANGQALEDAYRQAAQVAEFAPIWASGIGASGFWDFGENLSGWGGTTFVEERIRRNKMFPIF